MAIDILHCDDLPLRDRAGLKDCGLHTLRHTLASKMVKNGFSLYEVQSILGHMSPTTTTRYIHLESASVSKKVAEKLFSKERLRITIQVGWYMR